MISAPGSIPTQTATVVSTTAVKIVSAGARRSWLMQNKTGSTIYVGPTSGVTASGSTQGLAVVNAGTYGDDETCCDWYAINSAVSTLPVIVNVNA